MQFMLLPVKFCYASTKYRQTTQDVEQLKTMNYDTVQESKSNGCVNVQSAT
jgi:hypothetical protein